MSLQSSNLLSLQILNLTVRCYLLITRKFSFPMKPIYVKNNIQKKSTCFLFSVFIFLPLIVEHFYLQHNLYFNILYPNSTTSSSEEKKDQLDSCNSHDLIVSFSLRFPTFAFNFFCMEEKIGMIFHFPLS